MSQPQPSLQLKAANAEILDITQINVIVGRNGSGKSRFLRALATLRGEAGYYINYISPERAGSFEAEASIENTMRRNANWLEGERAHNQASNFKRASASRLKELATRFAIRMENDHVLRSDLEKTFASEQLSKINQMLMNVAIERDHLGEFIFRSRGGDIVAASDLSSGESELVALATEVMHFFELAKQEASNLLLLDEPDVHLHPDLQGRLARFLVNQFNDLSTDLQKKTFVFVATHSTPLICELATSDLCSIGVKEFENNVVRQKAISDALKKVAPFFGHPLSKFINEDSLVIVEGEDDQRVLQQAARTAQGRLKLFPCVAASVDQQTELERFVDSILSAIYDEPRAISFRDGDGSSEILQDIGCVRRHRLQCYAAENLLVTDDVLLSLGATWQQFTKAANEWLEKNPTHSSVDLVKKLIKSSDRCRNEKIKAVRQLIPVILNSKKPWEVIVGQILGQATISPNSTKEFGIVNFLGMPLAQDLGLKKEA